MCRYQQLWGAVMAAFGLGFLLGMWVTGGFFCHFMGFGAIVIGFGIFRRK